MKPYLFNALLALALVGCEGVGTTPEGDASARSATIQGTARRSGTSASATQILVFHVNADGTLAEDASGGTTTDEDGRYSVKAEIVGEGESNLLVQALYEDGTSAMVMLNGQISGGTTHTAPPMDEETSAEADLFLAAVASGSLASDADEAAFIRAFVDASVAAAYNEADEAERSVIASATAAAVVSFMSAGDAAGEQALDAWLSALVAADAAADAASDSGGEASVDAWAALEGAWSSSGLSAADLAFAVGAAAEAHGHMSEGEHGEGIDSSGAFLAQVRAELMAEVVGEAWGDLGESDSEEAEEEASENLLDELSGIVNTGASYDEAMSEYTLTLLAELEATMSAEGAEACGEAAAVAASAQAELSAAIRSASDSEAEACGEAVSEAMDAYRAEVEVEVVATLEASGAFDESEVHAIATIMGQLYAHAE